MRAEYLCHCRPSEEEGCQQCIEDAPWVYGVGGCRESCGQNADRCEGLARVGAVHEQQRRWNGYDGLHCESVRRIIDAVKTCPPSPGRRWSMS